MMHLMDPAVAAELAALPLARLTHFTPSRNLPHILSNGELRSVSDMQADVLACYAPTDRLRLDGHPEKICCSLQYPNGYYLAIARANQDATNFPDWVCLLLDKAAAASVGTLFCPRNAASGSGGLLAPGVEALRACYAPSVVGQGGRTRTRGPRHDPGSPTDVQAEVLVTAPVPLSLVRAIVVPSETAAAQEHGRLEQLGLDPDLAPWSVSPGMFSRGAIAAAVTSSSYFKERTWSPNTTSAR